MTIKSFIKRLKRYSNLDRALWRLKVGTNKFALYQFEKNGVFDYDRYKRIQTQVNQGKIHYVNVQKEDMDFLSKFIKSRIPHPQNGICHGTRRGDEQKWLGENLGCEVIGTEISDTASQFPKTIQWDFHDENPAWLQKFDFIYTNSFDHSYDPKKALTTWMKTLKPNGMCLIEHSLQHTPASTSESDPFGASLDIMPFLVLMWSEGRYSVREIIETPARTANQGQPRTYLVIMNN